MSGDGRGTDVVPASTGRGMTIARGLLLGAGVVVAGFGVLMLVQSGLANILAALWWLVGGVVAHDALLAPLTVVLFLAAGPVMPTWLRAPMTVAVVVVGTVTVAAIPVLGRFGALPDNPTLLDRNYIGGWLVFAALAVLAVAVAGWRRRSTGTRLAAKDAETRTSSTAPGWRLPP